jgi:hypothetical protein
VTADQDARIRRYLLGQASDAEAAAIEQEYFLREAALDSVAAEEEALIEDYLSSRLNADDRQQFEAVYLASPTHRRRVAVVRELAAKAGRPVFRVTTLAWGLPAAAAVLLAIGLWLFQRQDTGDVAVDETQSDPGPSTPESAPPRVEPRVFSMALVPSGTRAADENIALVIPEGIESVSLTLRGEQAPDAAMLEVIVRTVPGQEVWRGPARHAPTDEVGVSARADIPAPALPPDDYVVTLLDQAGEVNRYFLRVRDR